MIASTVFYGAVYYVHSHKPKYDLLRENDAHFRTTSMLMFNALSRDKHDPLRKLQTELVRFGHKFLGLTVLTWIIIMVFFGLVS